jgi:hypothetical protein
MIYKMVSNNRQGKVKNVRKNKSNLTYKTKIIVLIWPRKIIYVRHVAQKTKIFSAGRQVFKLLKQELARARA